MHRTEIEITYFKLTGKEHTSARLVVESPEGDFPDIVTEVRRLRREKLMPGLAAGTEVAGNYHVLVDTMEELRAGPSGPPGGKRLIPADEELQIPAYVPIRAPQG